MRSVTTHERCKLPRVAQSEIESLARDRMQRLCRIADEHGAAPACGLRDFEREVVRRSRVDRDESARALAESILQVREKRGRRFVQDLRGVLAPNGPDEGVTGL